MGRSVRASTTIDAVNVISLTALVLAASGGAYAATDASVAKKHKRQTAAKGLTKAQVVSLVNQQLNVRHVGPGPAGSQGAMGAAGSPGAAGSAGPQGPGAKAFTFDSTTPQATSTPQTSTLVTGPATFGARCFKPSATSSMPISA